MEVGERYLVSNDLNIYDELMNEFYDKKLNNKAEVNSLFLIVNNGLNSDDERIKNIYEQIFNIKRIEPRFNVFFSTKMSSAYLSNFKALNINKDDIQNYLILSHEYGHAMFDILLNKKVPEEYSTIMEIAKKHALTSNNINFNYGSLNVQNAKFRDLIEYICDKSNKESLESVGPFSDIISSMWQTGGFKNSKGDPFILPFSHPRETYFDNENHIKYDVIFDEQFANFFALKSTNSNEALETLKNLFGVEWYNFMDKNIDLMYDMINNNSKLSV